MSRTNDPLRWSSVVNMKIISKEEFYEILKHGKNLTSLGGFRDMTGEYDNQYRIECGEWAYMLSEWGSWTTEGYAMKIVDKVANQDGDGI